jgi:hypothetical protein
MEANHCFTELVRQFGVLRQIIEQRRAKSLFHDRLAGLNRVLKLLETLPHQRSCRHEDG